MSNRIVKSIVVSMTAIAFVGLAALQGAKADEADAKRILKSMSDYVASQKTLSIAFDSDIEVVTDHLQKIQFNSSGTVLLQRPDKIRATRTGGYANVQLVFDGKTLSILGKDQNVFAQVDAPGSVDKLVDRLRNEFSAPIPGADLLASDPYNELIDGVIDAKYIGRGVIDGVECDHLAFRNRETDWQLWVQVGEHPIPRKYVITSKAVTGAPQYTLRITKWTGDTPMAADTFEFKPPENAKKLAVRELPDLDEVPMGTVEGGKK